MFSPCDWGLQKHGLPFGRAHELFVRLQLHPLLARHIPTHLDINRNAEQLCYLAETDLVRLNMTFYNCINRNQKLCIFFHIILLGVSALHRPG